MVTERIGRWFAANGDLAVGAGAAILFVVALTLAPKAACSPVTASGAFNAVAWVSGLGFVLAGVLAFFFRASTGSKVGLFLVGLVVAVFAAVALASAASPNGFGFQDSERGTQTMQEALRGLARARAPWGQHAYWLGESFRGATLSFASGGWTRYALVRYAKSDGVTTTFDFDVRSYTHGEDAANRAAFPTAVRMRAATGQDVVVFFRRPKRVDAALVRDTRAALKAIPRDVTYEGCAS